MSNEEKILQMLGQMQGQLSGLDGRMGSLEAGQTEMRADIDSIKAGQKSLEAAQTEMKGQLDFVTAVAVRTEADVDSMKVDIDSIKIEQTEMREHMVHVDERTRHTGVLVENTLVPNVQLLFEGHVTILHQMETLPAVVQLQEDVSTLRVAVKILGDDVAVLKKAI